MWFAEDTQKKGKGETYLLLDLVGQDGGLVEGSDMSLDVGPHSLQFDDSSLLNRIGQTRMMFREYFRLVPHGVQRRLESAFAEELVSFVESARRRADCDCVSGSV